MRWVYGSEPQLRAGNPTSLTVPLFFFHVRDGDGLTEDPDGSELPDLRAAKAEAVVAAFEITAAVLRAGKTPGARRFEIRDKAGRTLATVPFPDVSNSP